MTTKSPPLLALYRPPAGDAAAAPAAAPVPDGALSPGEVLRRATANVEHLNRNGPLLVVGEVTEPKVGSTGHLQFKLKDEGGDGASLSCIMWFNDASRLRFKPEQGTRVLATGKITVSKFASVQLVTKQLEPLSGEGIREAQFQKLKQKLDAEGLFSPEHKQPLPTLPRSVGIVTSFTGDAIHDVLKRLNERMPGLRIVCAHTKVQGDEAPAEIADAIRRLDKSGTCDVMLVVRGGGSQEDLWAYNSESVARAIYHATTPIITGIGHDKDLSIADLVADASASTPTAAAVRAVPERAALLENVAQLERRARNLMEARLQRAQVRVLRARERVLQSRAVVVGDRRQRTHGLMLRLERLAPARVLQSSRLRMAAVAERLLPLLDKRRERARRDLAQAAAPLLPLLDKRRERARRDLAQLAARLHALSPLAVLGRGYAVVTRVDDARVVRSVHGLEAGTELSVRVDDGVIDVAVIATEPVRER